MDNDADIKKSFLFKRLILTFHGAAMQQMGKLVDPISGKIVRDLDQASFSIDTLDMLQEKCQGNLTEDEAIFFEHILSELKLNYVDEVGRTETQQEKTEETTTESQSEQAGSPDAAPDLE